VCGLGWGGLRAVRAGAWKYLAAPRPELFDVGRDPAEGTNLAEAQPQDVARLDKAVAAWSTAEPGTTAPPPPDLDTLRKLAAGVADGYALSLRRVERLLPTWDVEPIRCTDGVFDPELMEVVEVVGDQGPPPGAGWTYP